MIRVKFWFGLVWPDLIMGKWDSTLSLRLNYTCFMYCTILHFIVLFYTVLCTAYCMGMMWRVDLLATRELKIIRGSRRFSKSSHILESESEYICKND